MKSLKHFFDNLTDYRAAYNRELWLDIHLVEPLGIVTMALSILGTAVTALTLVLGLFPLLYLAIFYTAALEPALTLYGYALLGETAFVFACVAISGMISDHFDHLNGLDWHG